MNTLSLFDGISCGQVALKRIGRDFNEGQRANCSNFVSCVLPDDFPVDELKKILWG